MTTWHRIQLVQIYAHTMRSGQNNLKLSSIAREIKHMKKQKKTNNKTKHTHKKQNKNNNNKTNMPMHAIFEELVNEFSIIG